MKKIVIIFIATALSLVGASAQKPYSVRMVESEMARNPKASMLDGMGDRLKWNYTTGLELLAVTDAARRYGIEEFWDYAAAWADTIVDASGAILTYKQSNYNIDHICPGRLLFRVYDRTGEKRYRKALTTLFEQIEGQPRTAEGGFWHKKIYPYQMWLDGLYMGQPFYAEYVRRYGKNKNIDAEACWRDIASQFAIVAKGTYDPATGLYRHAWDSSHEMFWCDSLTGQSAHAWGRAMGWYAMAIVETLDYMPEKTEGREGMISTLRHIYDVLPRYADPETGMWYQVLDSPQREGNYLEATASAMFTYAMLKGVRQGYLDHSMKADALALYEKFVRRFVRENPDGTISITDCCSVAGLGGKTMRSGTFDYYISEPIIENDCKGVGPFIWASLEYEAAKNIDYAPSRTERQLAFDTAMGYGRFASGGRGGKVLKVTSLADDGSEGTLRWAVEQKGARTVIFEVDGNIVLSEPLDIRNGDLTIAGQSAPRDGICITNHGVLLRADNVIVRYMRFRMGDLASDESDAFETRHCSNVIIDHCSVSWATDECASSYCNNNFTMQNCIISESLNRSVHKKGAHGYGAIWGGRNVAFCYNLLAHHASRNPRFDHPNIYHGDDLLFSRGTVDYSHNVVYNWGFKAAYGGEEGWWNVYNNYYKPGPASASHDDKFLEMSYYVKPVADVGYLYLDGNVLAGNEAVTADNWKGVIIKNNRSRNFVETESPFGGVLFEKNVSAEEAYNRVLQSAGASLHRDAVDSRIIDEVRSGTHTFVGSRSGEKGIIDSQQDVGGWPELRSGKPQKDSDGDGMPDRWERRNSLDEHNPSDGAAINRSTGYSNLEMYLNSLTN